MGIMKKYGLPTIAICVVLILVYQMVETWSHSDKKRFDVADCWIDSTSATFHITVLMPDSVLKEMARIGTESADVEFIGPTINSAMFKEMMLDGIERRAGIDKAAKLLGESLDQDIDVDKHKARNGGIFDKERRR